MTTRFYVVPKIGDGSDINNAFRPKYIADAGVLHDAMDYGLEDTFLVGAEVTDEQHTQLSAQVDVISIPADLDSNVSLAALSIVQLRLESLNVPADWVTTNHTYRQIIGLVGRLFQYAQRFHVKQLRRFFESGITLETRVNQLTQAQRNAMLEVANDLGLDTSGIAMSMKLRAALKILADQMPQFTLFGETF